MSIPKDATLPAEPAEPAELALPARRETGHYAVTIAGGESSPTGEPAPRPLDLSGAISERLRAAEQALVRLELAG